MHHDSLEWTLTHASGRSDVIGGALPSIPTQMAILAAWTRAQGWRTERGLDEGGAEGSEVVLREDELDPNDLAACGWAALGASWSQPALKGMPAFREYRRDVVAYGEAVMTALWREGYRELPELARAARATLDAMYLSTYGQMEEVKRTQEGFGKAQQPT